MCIRDSYIGASLAIMERDARLKRGELPFLFTNLKDGTGLEKVIAWLQPQLDLPAEHRRSLLASAEYPVDFPHNHDQQHG